MEAIRGLKGINEITRGGYRVHPNMVNHWKNQAISGIPETFGNKRGPQKEIDKELINEPYKQMGKQHFELDWLKKNLTLSLNKMWQLIEPYNNFITVDRQCSLTNLSPSNYYYHPLSVKEEELEIMKWIDKIYTDWTF